MISISPYNAGASDRPSRDLFARTCSDAVAQPSLWLDEAVALEVFSNARSAMWACLKHLKLGEADEVCIATTSNGPYISSCVTRTIESVCSWSRTITKATRLVIVIHEFGFPVEESRMRQLRELGIPILEDCAYATASRMEGASIGRYGDFAIYSLPKYYPIKSGGLLVSRYSLRPASEADDIGPPDGNHLSAEQSRDVLLSVSFSREVHCHWVDIRRQNWKRFSEDLSAFGVQPYFNLAQRTVPGVYVCRLPHWISGSLLKERFVRYGVEATEYYGHGGFYFPIHQFLSEEDILLMLQLFEAVQ